MKRYLLCIIIFTAMMMVISGCGGTQQQIALQNILNQTAKSIKGTYVEKAINKGLIDGNNVIVAKAWGVFYPAQPTEDFPLRWGEEESIQTGGQTGAHALVIPSYIRARGKKTIVAVFDIQDVSGSFDTKTMEQLTDYFSAILTQDLGFQVVPRDQLKTRLAQQRDESYKACYDEKCQIEIGKEIAAQKSIATKVIKIGHRCVLVSTMYDLKTETTEKAANAETDCSTDSLMKGVRHLIKIFASQK